MYLSGHQLFGYCSSHKTCLWVWETLSYISVVSILIQPDWTFLHWVGVYIIIVAILPGKTSEYWEDKSVTTVLIYSINHLSYEKMYQWLWYLFPPNLPRMLGTIFRSITQKRGSNNWYYKLIMQLLSNIRYHTSNDWLLSAGPPLSISTFYLFVVLFRIGCQEIHCVLQAAALVVFLSCHQTRVRVEECLLILLLNDIDDALLLLS